MTERRKPSDKRKRREENRSPQAEAETALSHVWPPARSRESQAIQHYRRDHQIADRRDLRGDQAVRSDFGFGDPVWALRVVLGQTRGETRQFSLEIGPLTLTLTALDSDYGLPNGRYSPLVFAWICQEVVRT